MANLAEYYSGAGGAEDLDWRDRRDIARAGGTLRYEDPSQLDDRYLRQITDYYGGAAAVPQVGPGGKRGSGYAVIDNPQIGAGGYRTVRNPMFQYSENMERAFKIADYVGQFLPADRVRDEVYKQSGIDLGGDFQTPSQRNRANFALDLEQKRGMLAKQYDELAQITGDRTPAGRDRIQRDEEDLARTAFARGVPMAADMTKGMTRAGSERLRQQQLKDADKVVETAAAESQKLAQVAQDATQFMSLNEKTATGPIVDYGPVGFVRRMGSDFSTMRSISDRLTPAMRNGLPGAASDRDVAMFKSATVSTDKPYEANLNIATALVQKANMERERVRFLDTYREVNRGSLVGANAAWQQYLDANPIFDNSTPEAQAKFTLNQNRVPWDDWFRVRTAAAMEQKRRERAK
jgi:hypothetical protein